MIAADFVEKGDVVITAKICAEIHATAVIMDSVGPELIAGAVARSRMRQGLCARLACTAPLFVAKGAGRRGRKCNGCLMALYCGVQCHAADWKFHKAFCRLVKPA